MMTAEQLRRLIETITDVLDNAGHFDNGDEACLADQLAEASEFAAVLAEKGY